MGGPKATIQITGLPLDMSAIHPSQQIKDPELNTLLSTKFNGHLPAIYEPVVVPKIDPILMEEKSNGSAPKKKQGGNQGKNQQNKGKGGNKGKKSGNNNKNKKGGNKKKGNNNQKRKGGIGAKLSKAKAKNKSNQNQNRSNNNRSAMDLD